MRQGKVDLVVVGADRIAANGDTANKIGTYSVAVLAREHKIPFYVAAPLSTIDLNTPDGDHIPIEERNAREVTHVGGAQLAPAGALIWNPAFDVTPHRVHRRHHHRARHLPGAVRRVAEAGVRDRAGGHGLTAVVAKSLPPTTHNAERAEYAKDLCDVRIVVFRAFRDGFYRC